jgi:hypothetical protein
MFCPVPFRIVVVFGGHNFSPRRRFQFVIDRPRRAVLGNTFLSTPSSSSATPLLFTDFVLGFRYRVGSRDIQVVFIVNGLRRRLAFLKIPFDRFSATAPVRTCFGGWGRAETFQALASPTGSAWSSAFGFLVGPIAGSTCFRPARFVAISPFARDLLARRGLLFVGTASGFLLVRAAARGVALRPALTWRN